MSENLKTIETIDTSPFKHLVITTGELPSSFVESMTYYDCLAWLVDYLQNTVISAVNNNADALKELQDAFVVLKNYVDNYFDNLDVQEEINNKLDAMAEAGTLQEIIGDYLNATAVWGFDTVADMKIATNLINGSFAKTLGFYAKNDGGGATYKIRNITNDDVVDETTIIEIGDSANELIAELIMQPEMNIKQFGVTTSNTTNTKFQIAITKCANRELIIPEGTYRVDTAITLPDNITIKCQGKITYSSDLVYLFQHPDDSTSGTIVFDGINIEKLDNSFNNLNRMIYVKGGTLRVINSTFKNYATAIHAHFTDELYCDNNLFLDAYGTLPQYGYGIDTSSKRDCLTNNRFINTNNTYGRHVYYINGSTKEYAFVDGLYVEHWQHNPINLNINNTNPSKVDINNCTFKDVLITSPGSSTTNRIGTIQLADACTNVELVVNNLVIDGTYRGAVACESSTSWAKINNVYCKVYTAGTSTNWHGIYLRYNKYFIDNVHFEIPADSNFNHAIIVRGCNAYVNNVSLSRTYDKKLVENIDANLIIGLYANGDIEATGTGTITAMSTYSA